jgi:hypothetical protein
MKNLTLKLATAAVALLLAACPAGSSAAQAQKRVLAYQLDAAMKEAGITKAELARRMKTSRTQVDSLLNPENVTFRMDSAMKAARAVGKRIELALV